ncbi:Rv3235 family protein [Cellulomonas sp. S1-8]|uniref:Rv3235 family protein n=1 Tax=Cellulomonas sp. S1-8 TaxID=2904790 RepID=UPI0022434882|nr:Rv3235 family protein [Cellulomonas sp. S1-8]UZN01880.1 Rv3235 family protein [Cellulomonas sp. S1-8]
MTTVHHDDATPTTAVEDALTRLDVAPRTPSPARAHLSAVDPRPVRPDAATSEVDGRGRTGRAGRQARVAATVRAAGEGDGARPRLRLVPAPSPLRPTPAPAPAPPALLADQVRRLVAVDRAQTIDDDDERGAAPRTDAGRFAHGVGLACVEVVLGRRPAAQLVRWVTPDVLGSLHDRADLVRRAGVLRHARRPTARRVRVCSVDAYTAEVCLVVDDGVRVRAVAMRVEAHRGAWRVTTLEIG